MGSCGTQLRPMPLEVLKITIHEMSLKSTLTKLFPHPSEASELMFFLMEIPTLYHVYW